MDTEKENKTDAENKATYEAETSSEEYVHPYQADSEKKNVKDISSQGTIALVLGILALILSLRPVLAFAGLVLAILAVVKGAPIREFSTSAKAGWVLGIIALVLFGLGLILFLGFFSLPFFMPPHFMWCF